MGFNEKVHAFIAAKFYVYLTEAFGERGERAFIHGTQYYAEQRGRRMAQRAIRDGKELTYANYLEYGEWVNTQEIIDEGCANKSTIESWAPDYRIHITMCPVSYTHLDVYKRQELFPNVTSFQKYAVEGEAYKAGDEGYIVVTSNAGFAGDVTTAIGFDLNGAITGVVFNETSETQDYGEQYTLSLIHIWAASPRAGLPISSGNMPGSWERSGGMYRWAAT